MHLRRPRPAHSISGQTARGKRFILVASQFHPALARELVSGATRVLRRYGASAKNIRVVWVPGAFELPVVAAHAARSRPRPDAVIALGVLVRGETTQYDVIAHAVAQGLEQVAVSAEIPVTFGVIVAQTMAQAKARARRTGHNRGAEAALAAVAVLRLFQRMTH